MVRLPGESTSGFNEDPATLEQLTEYDDLSRELIAGSKNPHVGELTDGGPPVTVYYDIDETTYVKIGGNYGILPPRDSLAVLFAALTQPDQGDGVETWLYTTAIHSPATGKSEYSDAKHSFYKGKLINGEDEIRIIGLIKGMSASEAQQLLADPEALAASDTELAMAVRAYRARLAGADTMLTRERLDDALGVLRYLRENPQLERVIPTIVQG